MIERSKTFSGTVGLPFSLRRVYKQHKKDLIIKKAKNLPPIESYADAYDAQRVKQAPLLHVGSDDDQNDEKPFRDFRLADRDLPRHTEFLSRVGNTNGKRAL